MLRHNTAWNRVCEAWDLRLRVSERELLCTLGGVASSYATDAWQAIPPEETRRLVIAMRAAADLGREATYALGYQGPARQRKRGNANGQ